MCVVSENLILTLVIGAKNFINLRMINGEIKIINQYIIILLLEGSAKTKRISRKGWPSNFLGVFTEHPSHVPQL